MSLFKCVPFVASLMLVQLQGIQGQCPDVNETVIVKGEEVTVSWTWDNRRQLSESTPLCLYQDHNQSRECNGDRWGPQPSCDNIVSVPPKCPPGFKISRHETPFCYMVAERHPGPEKCPYPHQFLVHGATIFEWHDEYNSLTESTTFWLPIRRNMSNGIGLYETPTNVPIQLNKLGILNTTTGFDLQYVDESTTKLRIEESLDNITKKNCAIVNVLTRSVTLEDCNSTYPSVCSYKVSYNAFIHMGRESTQCRYVINDPNKCFYKVNSLSATESLRNDQFCSPPDHLAEPRLKNQNQLLDSGQSEGCWINLIKRRSRTFWISDNTTPNYSNWIYNTATSNKYGGAINYVGTPSYWNLYKTNTELKCAYCQRNSFMNNLKLRLVEANSSVKAIVLLNPPDLFNIHNLHVTCLTNSGKDIVSIVNLNYISDSNSYTFTKRAFGAYWCTGLLHGLPPLISNTLLRDEEVENAYVLRNEPLSVHADVIYNSKKYQYIDVSETKNLEEVCDRFMKEYSNLKIFSCKVMKIELSHRNNTSTSFKFVLQLMRSSMTAEELQLMMTEIDKVNKDRLFKNDINFNVTSVLETLCRADKTTYENRTIQWLDSRTDISKRQIVDGKCKVLKRKCLGDFVNGMHWGKVMEAECNSGDAKSCPEVEQLWGNSSVRWPKTLDGKKIEHPEGPFCLLSRECLPGGVWGDIEENCKYDINDVTSTTEREPFGNCPQETTQLGNDETPLQWPETVAGTTANISEDICLNSMPPYYEPVSRKCLANGVWDHVIGKCREKVTYSSKTELIYAVLRNATVDVDAALDEALKLTESAADLKADDLDVLGQILKYRSEIGTRSDTEEAVTKAILIVSNLMDGKQDELEESQRKRSTTDDYLHSVDDLLINSYLPSDGLLTVTTKNIISQVCNLGQNNYSWMTLINTGGGAEPEWNNIKETEESVLESLSTADVMVQLPKFFGASSRTTLAPKVSVAMFKKMSLFNDLNGTDLRTVSGNRVVSVTARGFNDEVAKVAGTFEIRFKIKGKGLNTSCAFWDYEDRRGEWKTEQELPQFRCINGTRYAICTFNHITHFSLLVGASINSAHEKVLDIITAAGCGLSALGIISIIVTGIIFKSWRSDNGHYVLIQFSIIVLLKYSLLYLAAKVRSLEADDCKVTPTCIATATLLHYILLSEFSWMLILAVLQYKRFVQVFKPASSESIVGFCAAGWLVPIIPALGVLITNICILPVPMYNSELCYPEGWSLYIGILLPIVIIIAINIIIFGAILVAIVKSKIQIKAMHHVTQQQSILKLSLKLGIFLFSLLGLSWTFGLLVAFNIAQLVFSYLFCATGTLQGVVMFMYFIVWNEKTRKLWSRILNCGHFKEKFDLFTNKSSDTTKSTSEPGATFKNGSDQIRLFGSNDKYW